MNKEEFVKEVKELGIPITDEILENLDKYFNLLIEENKKYNLTAITEEKDVYLKHFYDSLTITKIIKIENQSILDIGTGAGFPGIIIKIFFPETNIDLLDSTRKKCDFLNKVINTLNLKNIKVINARAEEYSKEVKEKYDIVTSRAVAPLKHLLEYSIPALKVNGSFISLKGKLEEEMQNIDNYYKKLSLINEKIITFNLPNAEGFRTLYKIEKEKPTNNIYPRIYSQIKKGDI